MLRLAILALALLVSGCEQVIPDVPDIVRPPDDRWGVTAFTSQNCGPCRRNEPRLREIERVVPVLRIDIDQQPQVAAKAGIQVVPTYVLFHNGVEYARTNDIETLARWLSENGQPP
jgi:thiol-disulfide isomerase/thioredoxin